MVTGIVDTSVIVDLLRGYTPSHNWYLAQQNLGVTRVVWLEIIEGIENRSSQRDALRLLKRFDLVELTAPDLV